MQKDFATAVHIATAQRLGVSPEYLSAIEDGLRPRPPEPKVELRISVCGERWKIFAKIEGNTEIELASGYRLHFSDTSPSDSAHLNGERSFSCDLGESRLNPDSLRFLEAIELQKR